MELGGSHSTQNHSGPSWIPDGSRERGYCVDTVAGRRECSGDSGSCGESMAEACLGSTVSAPDHPLETSSVAWQCLEGSGSWCSTLTSRVCKEVWPEAASAESFFLGQPLSYLQRGTQQAGPGQSYPALGAVACRTKSHMHFCSLWLAHCSLLSWSEMNLSQRGCRW